MNLGYKSEYGAAVPTLDSGEERENPTIYPSLNISGSAAKKLTKAVNVGDEITVTMKVRVVEARDRAENSSPYNGTASCNVELECLDAEFEGISDKDDDEGEDAETAFESYKKKSA